MDTKTSVKKNLDKLQNKFDYNEQVWNHKDEREIISHMLDDFDNW